MKSIAEVLAANVVRRRKELGMTQAKLAECIDRSTTTVQQIERCEAWVGLDTVSKLATKLKTTEVALFQDEDALNTINPFQALEILKKTIESQTALLNQYVQFADICARLAGASPEQVQVVRDTLGVGAARPAAKKRDSAASDR
jgi:transcriptional regulator with XRE-family HTH domain